MKAEDALMALNRGRVKEVKGGYEDAGSLAPGSIMRHSMLGQRCSADM